MTPLSQLTRRNYLIAAHDGLATVVALVASFYLRFDGGEAFYARLPQLLRILPSCRCSSPSASSSVTSST
jgi:hypothetical protein